MAPRIQYPELYDRDWMERQIERGLTSQQIAAEIGCCKLSVSRARKRLGLTGRRGGCPRYSELDDREWLRQRADRPATEVAAEIGCSHVAVYHAYRRHGIPRCDLRWYVPQLHDRAWLMRRSIEASDREIAAELGCTNSAVEFARQRLGIPARRHRQGR